MKPVALMPLLTNYARASGNGPFFVRKEYVSRITSIRSGMMDFDFSVQKGFSAKERIKLQLRVDALNVFNHPSFNGINSTLNFPAVGIIRYRNM